MSQISKAIARHANDARYFVADPAPSYSHVNRWIIDAAVELRDLLAAGKTDKAEALAAEIEEYQRGVGGNLAPMTDTAATEVWRLTLPCWAGVLIHGPRAWRTFRVHAGSTAADALHAAAGLYQPPFGGLHVERDDRAKPRMAGT